MEQQSIAIIGAGFAGLSAGIFAQMNGYKTEIFEMHNLPGGLCTAWKRKGYTIDGCIHWLVGSSPKSTFYQLWEQVGIAQNSTFINLDEFARYEGSDGRTLILHVNVDRLKKHLLETSPEDERLIRQMTRGIRLGIKLDQLSNRAGKLQMLINRLRLGWLFVSRGKELQMWMKTTTREFVSQFKDPLIRDALENLWLPDFSAIFLLFTFAYLHTGNAGYPLGGSMPISRLLEKRYRELGGTIHYNARVEKVLVENGCAAGVRLADGSEHRAQNVISAADGYSTIFRLLDGNFIDENIQKIYDQWPTFQPLIYVGLGVNRTFEDEPRTVDGVTFTLKQPAEIGDGVHSTLAVHLYNHDSTLAPEGKTSIVVMIPSDYAYWKELSADRAAYDEKKDQVARTVVELLEQRFPGISGQVEMVDVATPLTFERYTGNWKGSFEGWLITPQNAHTMMAPMEQTLPGLKNFYMCGQWVEPGGGLPTGVSSAHRLVQSICKADGKKFTSTKP